MSKINFKHKVKKNKYIWQNRDIKLIFSNPSIQEIVLKNGNIPGTFAFNVGTGYLYSPISPQT